MQLHITRKRLGVTKIHNLNRTEIKKIIINKYCSSHNFNNANVSNVKTQYIHLQTFQTVYLWHIVAAIYRRLSQLFTEWCSTTAWLGCASTHAQTRAHVYSLLTEGGLTFLENWYYSILYKYMEASTSQYYYGIDKFNP